MADIMDYLDWRGDLPFDQSPFNEVDNLILAQLSYVALDGLLPGPNSTETRPLCEVSDAFFACHEEKELLKSLSLVKMTPFLMRKVASTRRFENILLSKYVNIVDLEVEKQFSALYITLPDGTDYVAYRGTDNTLVGWKEDFNMSFIMPVPSQLEAAKYLNAVAGCTCAQLRIGGHSKGGNLAVYAAVHCEEDIKERILQVYNNDGPGFQRAMLESPAYQAMRPRITMIVPQSSIVGMLLEHDEIYEVVKSRQNGILQHDAMSWEVLGSRFVRVPDRSAESKEADAAIRSWLSTLSENQRVEFVEGLFSVLEATGAKTLDELASVRIPSIRGLLKTYGYLDGKMKEMLFKTIVTLSGEYGRSILQSVRQAVLPGSSTPGELEM